MNTVLVLVMALLVIFALTQGMVWVAMGVGVLMVLLSASGGGGGGAAAPGANNFVYPSSELPPITPTKEQMLRVKYEPQWDGNNWWEDMADHWGSSMGRAIGLLR